MKRLCLLFGLTVLIAACNKAETPAAPAAPAAPAPQPHATLAQLMRGIPFPNSNIIFDAQSEDPAAAKKPAEGGGGQGSLYSNVYGGWQAVENAAMAITETSNLLLIPGRKCENGRDVPVGQEDFRKWTANLAEAGKAAYKAAQAKNQDQIVEVSGTVAEACAMCHEKYRDKDDLTQRCIP